MAERKLVVSSDVRDAHETIQPDDTIPVQHIPISGSADNVLTSHTDGLAVTGFNVITINTTHIGETIPVAYNAEALGTEINIMLHDLTEEEANSDQERTINLDMTAFVGMAPGHTVRVQILNSHVLDREHYPEFGYPEEVHLHNIEGLFQGMRFGPSQVDEYSHYGRLSTNGYEMYYMVAVPQINGIRILYLY